MIMRMFIGNSEFVSGASPVIIHTNSGQSTKVASDYSSYELSSKIPRPTLGIVKQIKPFYTLSEFSVMKNFDMFNGLFSGTTLMDMAQDNRIEAIWPDRVTKKMSALSQPYPIADINHTYAAYPSTSKSQLYFTSMDEVRRIVGADVANSMGYNGKGINVVVSDTGGTVANVSTPQITKQSAIDHLYHDEIGHGEWVASAIVGRPVKDRAFSLSNPGKTPIVNQGIAQGVNLTEVKALDFVVGTASDSILIKSLDMAINDGADIVSCSWGGPETYGNPQDDPFYIPLSAMMARNIVPVIAAGNSGPSSATVDSPGAMPQALTVGAYNVVGNSTGTYGSQFGKGGYIANFSSRGPTPWKEIKPDTVAPGAIIDNAIDGYLAFAYSHIYHGVSDGALQQILAGTSMATPIVAGLVSIMRQIHLAAINKILTVSEIKQMLSTLGHVKNNNDGWGMISYGMYQTWMKQRYGVTI